MRRLTRYALAILSTVWLAACANHAVEADRLRQLAVTKFNEGDFRGGIEAAQDLKKYDRNESAYLVGQFMVYGAGSHGLNFLMGLDSYYKDVLSIEVGASDIHANEILAAKLFALRFSEALAKARIDSKEVCAAVHKGEVDSCIEKLMTDAEKKYLADPSRVNAIYLYQSARLGQDVSAANVDESIFLSGLALFRMDVPRARLSIDILERRKAVTRTMWDRYCPLAQKLELDDREEVCAAAKYANEQTGRR